MTPQNKSMDSNALPPSMRGKQSREATFDATTFNEDERTVELALSSEAAEVERSWGMEILEHSESAIDLTRAEAGLPLLVNHETDALPVGRLLPESFRIGADKVLRATAKISRNAEGLWTDLKDGIVQSVSIGYELLKMEKEEREARDGLSFYRATLWRIHEASLVSVPADFVAAGVGRSQDDSQNSEPTPTPEPAETRQEIKIMTEKKPELTAEQVRKSELERIGDLEAMGEAHGEQTLARKAVRDGSSVEEFQTALLGKLASRKPTEAPDNLGMDAKEAKSYSFLRVINALANPTNTRAQDDAAFEFECSRAVSDVLGKRPQGIYVPQDVQERELSAGTATAGGNTVATDLLADSFIERLEKNMVTAQVATILRGLSGDVAIPRNSGTNTAGWISAEGGDSTVSDASFAQVSLTPKTVGGYSDISRRLLIQSSMDIEAFVRNDLASRIAQAMDAAALNGSGSSGQPTGIENTSGVNTATVATDGDPTFAEMVGFETAVADDEALAGRLAYMTTTAVVGNMKVKIFDSGSGRTVMENGMSNGREVFVSNNMSANQIFFGNWSDLLIGFFGGLDVNVDTATGSRAGTVRIVALQDADIAVRNAVSFCIWDGA